MSKKPLTIVILIFISGLLFMAVKYAQNPQNIFSRASVAKVECSLGNACCATGDGRGYCGNPNNEVCFDSQLMNPPLYPPMVCKAKNALRQDNGLASVCGQGAGSPCCPDDSVNYPAGPCNEGMTGGKQRCASFNESGEVKINGYKFQIPDLEVDQWRYNPWYFLNENGSESLVGLDPRMSQGICVDNESACGSLNEQCCSGNSCDAGLGCMDNKYFWAAKSEVGHETCQNMNEENLKVRYYLDQISPVRHEVFEGNQPLNLKARDNHLSLQVLSSYFPRNNFQNMTVKFSCDYKPGVPLKDVNINDITSTSCPRYDTPGVYKIYIEVYLNPPFDPVKYAVMPLTFTKTVNVMPSTPVSQGVKR